MAHDVFISYAHQDREAAEAVSARLEKDGIRTWMAPRDVLPGANFAEAIIEAIEGSRVCVLIWTARANASEHVLNEVCHAFDERISILPLRLEEVKPTKAMAYYLGRTHWLDALTLPQEEALAKLSATVKAILDRQWETMPFMPGGGIVQAKTGTVLEYGTTQAEPATPGEEQGEKPIESLEEMAPATVPGTPEQHRAKAAARPRRRQGNRRWMLAGMVLAAVLLLGGLTAAGILLARGWERVNADRTRTAEATEALTSLPAESLTAGPAVTDTAGPTPSRTATPTRTATPVKNTNTPVPATAEPTWTETATMEPPTSEPPTETLEVTLEVPAVEGATPAP